MQCAIVATIANSRVMASTCPRNEPRWSKDIWLFLLKLGRSCT